jgi:diguanylate cyclase (GGDEF)-like protein
VEGSLILPFNLAEKGKYLSPRLSFQWKIGLVICLISVSITSLGFYYFYTASYQITLGLLQKDLRNVGNVGVMLFDKDSREALKRLKKRALEEAQFDRKIIDALPIGGTTRTISPEKIKELHASDDFQTILLRLQMITYSSFKKVGSLKKSYEFDPMVGWANGMIGTYLMIDLMNILSEDVGMYIASSYPDPVIANGYPENPIGNTFRSFVPFSKFNQKTYVHNELITDAHYQSLSASVPILDENNQAIAVLGLDYSVGPELAKLHKLKSICFVLIIASLLLSFLISFFISKSLNAPLYKLYEAAKKVSQNDYTATVDIKTKDEFGLLGQVFNKMLASIQTSFNKLDLMNKNLEGLVVERTQELLETNEELKSKNHRLEILSTTDMLTGLFNRRCIEEQIQIAINRSERYGQDMSIVMLDIDHFKSVNDTSGHDVGDGVLVSIAKILKENIREVDVAGRWGGEEFIILFQADNRGAMANAEKLRVKINDQDHGDVGNVTASFGYTQYIKNDTIDSLIKRADQGLYKAKENGRNRAETVTN